MTLSSTHSGTQAVAQLVGQGDLNMLRGEVLGVVLQRVS